MSIATETKHTPGPWTAWFNDPDEYGYLLEAGIDTADRKVGIADIHCDNIDKDDPAEWNAIVKADAALIAAAPEMLRQLRELRDWIPQWMSGDEADAVCDGIDDVIRQATA